MTVDYRFVVTGSGRCGTRWISEALTAAGVSCGHERVFNATTCGEWPDDIRADSSWMAATMLDRIDVPVALLVRHPLNVVRSWVEIGFFSHYLSNPTHGPLRRFAPQVYDWPAAADRALDMWFTLTSAALGRAEVILRLEHLDAGRLARFLGRCGGDPAAAAEAIQRTPPCNRHEGSRVATGINHEPDWAAHDPVLAGRAKTLARLLGYEVNIDA